MRSSSRRAVAALIGAIGVIGVIGVIGAMLLVPGGVLAAEPPATPAPGAGDPRSAGEGPGLVGDPLFAIGIVAAIGLAALVVSLVYVRMTAGRETRPDS